MTFSPEKLPFSRRKFLMPFFNHRPGFSDFTFHYCIKCRIRPFLHQKNHYFRKEFVDKTIFYSVRTFARIQQHYFSKYWGTNAWAVPLKFFLGGPSPVGLRPWGVPLNLGLFLFIFRRIHLGRLNPESPNYTN